MNKLLLIFIVITAGCAANKQPGTTVQKPVDSDIAIKSEEDKEEYDIIIDEPAFSSWLTTNGDPKFERSNQYYKNWNQTYVAHWNSQFANNINYDYSKDYGYEVNYKLYHYFQFMQARYGIDLPGGRRIN